MLLSSTAFAGTCKVWTNDTLVQDILIRDGFNVIRTERAANVTIDLHVMTHVEKHGVCGFLPRNCSQENHTLITLGIYKRLPKERRQQWANMKSDSIYYEGRGDFAFPNPYPIKLELLNRTFLSKVRKACK